LQKHEALLSRNARIVGLLLVAVSLVVLALVLLATLSPSPMHVAHRINLTTASGERCAPDLDGPVCPAQTERCGVLSESAWVIQGTQATVIISLLMFLWYTERPRRTFVHFAADNSKSMLLATMTHFLVIAITSIVGDVVVPHCNVTQGAVDVNPGAQPCDWYIVTCECLLPHRLHARRPLPIGEYSR
jgi:hypothetical protein